MNRHAAAMLLIVAITCAWRAATPATGAPRSAGHIAQAVAADAPRARMSATFAPERRGAATEITFTVSILQASRTAPPPLSMLDVSYPKSLGFATSGLGLAACEARVLEEAGPLACPPNSKVGSGTAVAEVAFGPEIVPERVALTIYAGPSPDGYLHLLILASGRTPVFAGVLLTAVLLPGHVQISVPPVPSLPGAPDVAFSSMKATLGGSLTYYERSRGRLIAYQPRGIALPANCPRTGWTLRSSLIFIGGQRSHAETVVPCPTRVAARSRRRNPLTPAGRAAKSRL